MACTIFKVTSGIRLRSIRRVVIFSLLCSAVDVSAAEAKILYVNGSTGNDATSYAANGPSAPWRTIGRALWGSTNRSAPVAGQAAQAGDTVEIACGLYQTTGTDTNGFGGIALSPVNSGTAALPIRIQSPGNQFACIQIQFTSGFGSVIGSHDKSYIQWSGFDLNETNTPWSVTVGHQSAQIWISGNEAGTTAVGNLVENTRLRGTVTSDRDGDNYTVFRLHGTTGTTIRNVHIRDVGISDENSAGILWYFSANITVENSVIENCGSGIYMKGESTPPRPGFFRFRYNRFINNHKGIQAFLNASATPATPGVIAQNIFKGGVYGVKIQSWEPPETEVNPNDLKFINNLFIEQQFDGYPVEIRGELTSNAGMLFQNNIIVGNGQWAYASAGGPTVASLEPARLLARHNVYQNVNSTNFAGIGVVASFATWKATYGQDNTAPVGILTAATLFSDADYHHLASSPALNQGRAIHGIGGADGTAINAGPYITGSETIGLLSGPAVGTPAAPTNLRITG